MVLWEGYNNLTPPNPNIAFDAIITSLMPSDLIKHSLLIIDQPTFGTIKPKQAGSPLHSALTTHTCAWLTSWIILHTLEVAVGSSWVRDFILVEEPEPSSGGDISHMSHEECLPPTQYSISLPPSLPPSLVITGGNTRTHSLTWIIRWSVRLALMLVLNNLTVMNKGERERPRVLPAILSITMETPRPWLSGQELQDLPTRPQLCHSNGNGKLRYCSEGHTDNSSYWLLSQPLNASI